MSKMRALFAAWIIGITSAGVVAAQSETATVTGRVTDRTTGRGIAGARLVLLSDSRSVTTDSLGKYEFRGLPAGVSRLMVLAEPFPTINIVVALGASERRTRDISIDSTAAGRAAQALPPVGVSAAAPVTNYRMVGFERRRVSGRGQYLTEEEIVRSGAFSVADAVKNLRGILYECGGGQGCFIRMARAPGRCLPEYVVDDQVQNDFGLTTPIADIVGIEVYSGPTDVPGEYAGRNAGCGVVVIWTRSGPSRKKP
jgi:hypothetical protein